MRISAWSSDVCSSDLRRELVESLQNITPAFGRGEKLIVNGKPLELVLVKNPGGFRLGLTSFDPEGYATMIAINDNYADGSDMRSEDRRVGKECVGAGRYGGLPENEKKNTRRNK